MELPKDDELAESNDDYTELEDAPDEFEDDEDYEYEEDEDDDSDSGEKE